MTSDVTSEILFIGNTYVYRGPYPRSEGKGAKRDLLVEQVRRRGGDEPSPVAKPITGTGLEEEPGENAQRPTEERGGDTL